jgi:prolyl-tRNA editing enzyme YbaK/EbsC (Cys-tRNA(Pro) deacylase)
MKPLGETLPSLWLDEVVISCSEAAKARKVPLKNELKSLIVQTSNGVCATHIRGDRRLSLRAVKRFLNVDQARLVSVTELNDLGLTRGTVCPFMPPVWQMKQLISESLLKLEFITTNNGTVSGYFMFEPTRLLEVPLFERGDFEVIEQGEKASR